MPTKETLQMSSCFLRLGGKPITPTGDASESFTNGNGNAAHLSNNHHPTENGATTVVDGATKTEVSLESLQRSTNFTINSIQFTLFQASQLQSTQNGGQNGTKSPQKPDMATKKTNGDSAPQTQISNQVIPGPQSASHVVIDDKKKKKCTCCVIQ